MKKYIFLCTAFLMLIISMESNASEDLCTEDFLFNASFQDVDGVGDPIDWKRRKTYETRGLTVENGALKMWVNEGGNFEAGGNEWLYLGQEPPNNALIFNVLSGDTMYVRAKVKSTAIDVPTDEELLELYRKDDPNKDTSGAKYNENLNSQGGFQLAIQQAKKPGSPPWFIPLSWTPVTNHDGNAIDEWTWLTGKAEVRLDANYITTWIFLNSHSACTVWIDSIQMSSSPDFCTGAVPVAQKVVRKNNRNIAIHNNVVRFGKPLSYSLKIFGPNGRLYRRRSGHAQDINLKDSRLPSGSYIIDLKSDVGNLTRSIVIHGSNY